MEKISILLIVTLTICKLVHSQESPRSEEIEQDSIARTPAKSGLSYEALTQFYQASFTSGQNGGFKFKSSLFGIQKLFSKNDLNLSQYYLAKKGARNFEFSLGVDKSINNKIENLRIGGKYALINNRSKSDVNFLNTPEIQNHLKNLGQILVQSSKIYLDSVNSIKDSSIRNRSINEFKQAMQAYTKSQKTDDLPAGLFKIIDSLSQHHFSISGKQLVSIPQKTYDTAAKKIEQRSLLTFEFSPGYNWSEKRFDSIAAVLQYLKGFGNYERPWNFDGHVKNYFLKDTLGKSKNLSRSIAVAQIGLNKVLVIDTKKNPLIEFEMAFEDAFVHRGLYNGEDRNKLSFNTILRVHISQEITIPLTLKYDLKNPNLFGFLQFNWSFENKKSNDEK